MQREAAGSPHAKALLLLSARLSRAPLPIADYITDTKAVMDQALRVGNALVDMAAHALGSPPSMALLRALTPRFWFAGHLHTPARHPFKHLIVDSSLVRDAFGC